MKHAIFNMNTNSKKHRLAMKEEIEAFIQEAHEDDKKAFLKDIYLTKHEPRVPKYHTNNEKEDEEFYNYYKSLEQYNDDKPVPYTPQVREGIFNYKRGSIL